MYTVQSKKNDLEPSLHHRKNPGLSPSPCVRETTGHLHRPVLKSGSGRTEVRGLGLCKVTQEKSLFNLTNSTFRVLLSPAVLVNK